MGLKLSRLILASAAVIAGCGRHYAEFQLPPAEGLRADIQFEWRARAAPVLRRDPPGAWDSIDVLNPAIVKYKDLYWNFYSGFDGKTWHTGLAISADGLTWVKTARILSPDPSTWEGGYIAANGSVLEFGHELLYWYQAGIPPQIGLARSPDGRRWTKNARPVLPTGPRGSWDERGVADPYVISAAGRFYMFFLGQDRARRQRLGVAMSDNGVNWTKLRSNPVLELGSIGLFDEAGLGEPAVWTSHGRWWMLYTGRDRKENRRLGLAESADGVRWIKIPSPVIAGDQAWNARVLCDPAVEVRAEGVRVWFGGGDVARPDEHIHGQLGAGMLVPRPVQSPAK